MNNFTFCSPTELVFGRGAETQTGEKLAERFGRGRVLMVYGGGSIKRTGVYGRVTDSLKKAGFEIREKGGVRPNPDIEFVRALIEEGREFKPDVILAVGGGSVIDASKAAAMGIPYEGDVWDFFEGKAVCKRAVPVAAVLTIPAAGSELSMRVVISNGEKKWGTASQHIRSAVSFINPELFYTLPVWQASSGAVDMMSHIMERYFTNTEGTAYVDGQAEAAMRTIAEYGVRMHADPKNYDAWSQLGLAGTFAHNGYFGLGHEEDWACHGMEHELSGWKPEITHGAGLAVLIPGYLAFVGKKNPRRVVQWCRNVMGADGETDAEVIENGISRLRAFYKTLEMPSNLRELGAGDAPLESLAKSAVKGGTLGKYVKLSAEDVFEIYKSVL